MGIVDKQRNNLVIFEICIAKRKPETETETNHKLKNETKTRILKTFFLNKNPVIMKSKPYSRRNRKVLVIKNQFRLSLIEGPSTQLTLVWFWIRFSKMIGFVKFFVFVPFFRTKTNLDFSSIYSI